MSGLDALQSVQFVTKSGKRFAVLSADDWESLIEWLETLEDAQIARKAFEELKAAEGDRTRAGWLKWDAVEGELT
jgi:PHD/YefM family antitoxin component YafN of YafNO toxin-antitoxin module